MAGAMPRCAAKLAKGTSSSAAAWPGVRDEVWIQNARLTIMTGALATLASNKNGGSLDISKSGNAVSYLDAAPHNVPLYRTP